MARRANVARENPRLFTEVSLALKNHALLSDGGLSSIAFLAWTDADPKAAISNLSRYQSHHRPRSAKGLSDETRQHSAKLIGDRGNIRNSFRSIVALGDVHSLGGGGSMTIPLAIRAEFDRRLAQGQSGVDARRMDRDVVNRNLALWRDMTMWTDGLVPVGAIDFPRWAAAAMNAAHKTAQRLSADASASAAPHAQHPSHPPALSVPKGAAPTRSDCWKTESTAHARALKSAAVKFESYATATAALRGEAEQERIAA